MQADVNELVQDKEQTVEEMLEKLNSHLLTPLL